MTAPNVREARLYPEHADQYPGIEPGVWFTAATLAEHINRRRGRGTDGGAPLNIRPLSADHFEFRGGEKPVGGSAMLGRRGED